MKSNCRMVPPTKMLMIIFFVSMAHGLVAQERTADRQLASVVHPDDVSNGDAEESYGIYGSNLIFVPPSSMVEGVVRKHDAASNEITVNLGSDQGVKVGYVFQVFRKTDQGDGVKGVIGAVKITAVQKNISTAQILGRQFVDEFIVGDRVRRPMFHSDELGKISISLSFTKEQRTEAAAMKQLLEELQTLAGSNVLITVGDEEHELCVASMHPPTKHDKQLLQKLGDYLRTQKHIPFESVTVPSLRSQQNSAGMMAGTEAGTDSADIGDATYVLGEIDWKKRNRELMQGLAPDSASGVPDERLAGLRKKADVAEQQSIETARKVRESLNKKGSKTDATRARLQAELREAVEAAFLARYDLHFMEVISLSMKSQAMSQKLHERTNSSSDIINRRVDDLLNPNYRWENLDTIGLLSPSNSQSEDLNGTPADVARLGTMPGKPFQRSDLINNVRDEKGSGITGPASQSENADSTRTTTIVQTTMRSSRTFPAEQVRDLMVSVKEQEGVPEAVESLRRITGLDFGDGIEQESRLAWRRWWEGEESNIEKATEGVRNFVVVGAVTDADGNPCKGVIVEVQVPVESSPTGQFQLGSTLSDKNGRYVLAFGIPTFAKADETTWQATITALYPLKVPQPDEANITIVKTLSRNEGEKNRTAPKQQQHEVIHPGRPVATNLQFQLPVPGKPAL